MPHIDVPELEKLTAKKFFASIAIVAIGLLLGLLLDRAVDQNKKNKERDETNSQLTEEIKNDRVIYNDNKQTISTLEVDTDSYLSEVAEALHEKKLLRKVFAAAPNYTVSNQSAWKTAQLTGKLSLLSYSKVASADAIYANLQVMDQEALEIFRAVHKSQALLATFDKHPEYFDQEQQRKLYDDLIDISASCKTFDSIESPAEEAFEAFK